MVRALERIIKTLHGRVQWFSFGLVPAAGCVFRNVDEMVGTVGCALRTQLRGR